MCPFFFEFYLFYFILFVLSLSVTQNTVGNAANIDFSPQAGWHINRTLFLRLLYGQPFVFILVNLGWEKMNWIIDKISRFLGLGTEVKTLMEHLTLLTW